MPFSPMAPGSKPEPKPTEAVGERGAQTEKTTDPGPYTWRDEREVVRRTAQLYLADTTTDGNGETWQQERQVRLTAQQILAEHLRDDRSPDQRSTDPADPRFWPNIRLDFTGATLIGFRLDNAVVTGANFIGATLSRASFQGTSFDGYVNFLGATFSGVSFERATFSGTAGFKGANFNSVSMFKGATFGGDADFTVATFIVAWFDGATFGGEAKFGGANVTFKDPEGILSFDRSHVLSPDAEHVWPTGWRLRPDGSGGHTVVRANDGGRC
jgi:Pentapeptide repeats (9 copies)/Pentapeptide repeats (8 copies)